MKLLANQITEEKLDALLGLRPSDYEASTGEENVEPRRKMRPALAKIVCPRSQSVYLRQRLFGLLDESRRNGTATFISGAPGSGKTTVLSSYVDVRDISCVWYRADTGDNESETFFRYFTRAANLVSTVDMPPLIPFGQAARPEIVARSKHFFRQLYERMPPDFLIVIDGLHEVADDALLIDVIRIAIEELPSQGHLVLTSRRSCPAAFSRLRLNGAMTILSQNDLTFTPVETLDMVALSGLRVTPGIAAMLDSTIDGWIAGLVIFLRCHDANAVLSDEFKELSCDYFEKEIFDWLSPEQRGFLMRCALLPVITAACLRRIAGIADGTARLGISVEENHFLLRCRGETARYRFHPLFRHYLLHKAAIEWDAERLGQLQHEAAEALATEGEHEAAFDLFAAQGNWKRARELVLALAPPLDGDGASPSIDGLLTRIPSEEIAGDAWLMYWQGMRLKTSDRDASLTMLKCAHRQFSMDDDVTGLAKSWSAVVDALFHDYLDLIRLDEWIGEFDKHLRNRLDRLPPETRAEVLLALFIAMCVRQPAHPELEALSHQLHLWLKNGAHPALTPLMRHHLAIHHLIRGETGETECLVGLFCSNEEALREMHPECASALHAAEASYALHTGRAERYRHALSKIESNAKAVGFRTNNAVLLCGGAAISLNRGDIAGAEQFLSSFERLAGNVHASRCDVFYAAAAWLKYYQGESANAMLTIQHAAAATDARGSPFSSAVHYVGFGLLAHLCGDTRQALLHLDKGRSIGRDLNNPLIEFAYRLFSSYIAFEIGKEHEAQEHLEIGMRIGRQRGYLHFMFFPSKIVSLLCLRSIESGMEIPYVRTLIDRNELAPDPAWAHAESWPWPIRIYTLGRFAIVKDGVAINHSGKSQKKPLDLLKALIAFGGRNVGEAKLADVLWPDADGDAAAQALATTLFRLRKLIGEKAVKRQDGRLTLDSTACWVDCWAFERLSNESAGMRTTRVAALRRLYQGPFLGDEEDAVWAMPMRERLRAKYARLAP